MDSGNSCNPDTGNPDAAARAPAATASLSPWVRRHAALVPAGGRVLDLACGNGRHARFFAGRGHPVQAVDIDIGQVADLKDRPGIEVHAVDLETGDWPFAAGSMAGIVIVNYLHRPHLARLPATLGPQGVVIIDTFAAGNERLGRPRNPDYLLMPGELLQALGQELQVVAYEHGIVELPRPAVRQRIIAVRSTGPVPLPP